MPEPAEQLADLPRPDGPACRALERPRPDALLPGQQRLGLEVGLQVSQGRREPPAEVDEPRAARLRRFDLTAVRYGAFDPEGPGDRIEVCPLHGACFAGSQTRVGEQQEQDVGPPIAAGLRDSQERGELLIRHDPDLLRLLGLVAHVRPPAAPTPGPRRRVHEDDRVVHGVAQHDRERGPD
ncbi:MAG TPA: hypothetical protein VFS98_03450 [Methylomirabilota bacterium]|nr:hypothetical protein [Methylomirabilota bacterium]